MAKYKRKISSTQRDKYYISAASQLKKAGIISKQAKLHGGHYISKSVLKKVKEFQHAADLGYKAYKVPKATAKAAQERGWQVVAGNKIIGPTSRTFSNRIKKGVITGVKPVKGGMMEEVELPHTVFDMKTLVEQLQEGIDTLKLPDERFAFKYQGNESYYAFLNTQMMLDWLRTYKNAFEPNGSLRAGDLQEEFDKFTIYRLHPNDEQQLIRRQSQRKADRIASGIKPERRHRTRKSFAEKLAIMPQARANRLRKKQAEKLRLERERRAANPTEYEAYKEAARKRAKASRDRRKGK